MPRLPLLFLLAGAAGCLDNPDGIQKGMVVDFYMGSPLAGFTVSDGDHSTTTDAMGRWTLPARGGAKLAPTVSGAKYSTLFMPEATLVGVEADYGLIPVASVDSLAIELTSISADPNKALVQVAVINNGDCKSIVGGKLVVNSPPGATVAYFNHDGDIGLPSLDDIVEHKAGAVIYNLPPGEALDVSISHPSCTQVVAGTAINGAVFTGQVKTQAVKPGDFNSTLVIAIR